MRIGFIFTRRGIRPYLSYSVQSGHLRKLSPGESVAFAALFGLVVVVSIVIVLAIF